MWCEMALENNVYGQIDLDWDSSSAILNGCPGESQFLWV